MKSRMSANCFNRYQQLNTFHTSEVLQYILALLLTKEKQLTNSLNLSALGLQNPLVADATVVDASSRNVEGASTSATSFTFSKPAPVQVLCSLSRTKCRP